MCERLSELREALQAYASGFDDALLTGPDAALAMTEAAAIEAVAANLKATAAARVDDTGAWEGRGDRSAAHHLARTTGTSVPAAAETLATAKRLEKLPALAGAARKGELSPQKASVAAEAAAADPGAEHRLLSRAKKGSLAELRRLAAEVKARAQPDPEAHHAAIHASRHLRTFTDREGAWNMRVRNTPEAGAKIMASLAPLVDGLFRAARAEGRREPVEAYAADALSQALLGHEPDAAPGPPGQGGPRRSRRRVEAKVIVRVDFEALLRGRAGERQVCEIVGFGPVPVSVVRDMIDSEDPFLAAVVTKGEQVTGVAHLGRRANAHQQTALQWLHPDCDVWGCGAQSRLQTDHRADWAEAHITLLDLLDRYCDHHHYLKTHHGWALVEGRGKRDMVPPDDPRHPRHKPPPDPTEADQEERGPPEAA